jgi:hypothetical protein
VQVQTESFLTHPQGERLFPPSVLAPSWPVDTPGGRFCAEFDPETPISREGQLVFFARFLHAGQRWERFLKNCPPTYTGNRGSKVVNVLGTAFMSVLAGHWRYAHINAIRGDALTPSVLGMTSTASQDVVRQQQPSSKSLTYRASICAFSREARALPSRAKRSAWTSCTLGTRS